MQGLGGIWYHFDPAEAQPGDIVEFIKSMTYIKHTSAYYAENESSRLCVSFKPDFFVQVLSDVFSDYIERALDFTRFRISFDRPILIDEQEFKRQTDASNREAFQKNCKKYGIALAELSYQPASEEKIFRSLEPLCHSFHISILLKENGRLLLLLLDESGFLKQLHFRAPLFEAAGAQINIYDQYDQKCFRISFEMEQKLI